MAVRVYIIGDLISGISFTSGCGYMERDDNDYANQYLLFMSQKNSFGIVPYGFFLTGYYSK